MNLLKAANEYKEKKEAEKFSDAQADDVQGLVPKSNNNFHKKYEEFAMKWLTFHARTKRLSPDTYDQYYPKRSAFTTFKCCKNTPFCLNTHKDKGHEKTN